MTTLKLRPYQVESQEAIWAAWDRGVRRPALVLPTGMGKTVIFASLADDFIKRRPDAGPVLILVHRDELIQQAKAKIHALAPRLRVGIVKAAKNEIFADVIIASVQTLAREKRRMMLPRRIGLVIVDEAHHAAAASYKAVLEHAGCFNPLGPAEIPGAVALGVTATMSRNDRLGLGDVWEEVVYKKDIQYGILNGFLTDVRGKTVMVDDLDLGSVARTRGDYAESALGDALTDSGAGVVAAEKYKELAGDRQGVAFWPTVATAYGMAEDFLAAGIPTEVITGKTPHEERELIYKRVRAGETQVLSNCMVLTEGFDMPQLGCAVIGRPTTSQALYVQMVGRVLRPWPGKVDALVLDVMGVSTKLALASIVDLSETRVRPKDDETLAEAMEREAKEAEEAGESYAEEAKGKRIRLSGQVDVKDVDLFHGSASSWLKTRAGVWFVPTREFTFFLWPDDGDTWKVGRSSVHSTKGGIWLERELPQEMALAIAEQHAKEADPSVSQRGASWRKDKHGSPAQISLAQSVGIRDAAEMRKSDLSNAISIHYASKLLDKTYLKTEHAQTLTRAAA